MPENVYEESRLAALYDYFNPWDDQDAFYLGRGRQCDGPVLDLDCGTGRLAVHIAEETDLAVTSAEPGTGMFHSTRSVLGLERVEWIQDLDQTFKTPTRFAFAYMTRHAFQPVHTSEAAIVLLTNVARNLTTEGRFVFETRNPEDRAWDRWAGDHTVVNTKEHGPVQESYEVEELSDGLMPLATTSASSAVVRSSRGAIVCASPQRSRAQVSALPPASRSSSGTATGTAVRSTTTAQR
jgi:SAM-dependent methyltransferase